MNVPRDRFIPAPNVDSAVVRLDRLAAPPVPGDEDRLFRLVRAAFAQRRKTLLNALSAAYGDKISKADLADLLKSLNIPENIRGEALTLTDFSRLSLTLDNYLAKR
jgi:16S rRNA (adenine1518-N6/adenine1519-N6)-dimethyltransferase